MVTRLQETGRHNHRYRNKRLRATDKNSGCVHACQRFNSHAEHTKRLYYWSLHIINLKNIFTATAFVTLNPHFLNFNTSQMYEMFLNGWRKTSWGRASNVSVLYILKGYTTWHTLQYMADIKGRPFKKPPIAPHLHFSWWHLNIQSCGVVLWKHAVSFV